MPETHAWAQQRLTYKNIFDIHQKQGQQRSRVTRCRKYIMEDFIRNIDEDDSEDTMNEMEEEDEDEDN